MRLPGRAGPTDGRPTLLFVSPVVPAFGGNGLAMRAAQTLRALAARYAITMLVVPRYASPVGDILPAAVAACCVATSVAHSGDAARRPWRGPLAGRFDVVHVFRLGSVAAAEPWLADAGRRWLDLDDDEPATLRAVGARLRARGDAAGAAEAERQAAEADAVQAAALSRFDRLFLADGSDAARLSGRGRGLVTHLPNVVDLPDPLPPPPPDVPPRLLFVGTLGYEPNVDGVLWFAREALPMLRAGHPGVELEVVGMGWSPGVAELARLPGVRLTGRVPDVRPCYAAARLAVVPVLAGGGTRIKALEAFALGRSVVGTSAGLAGLAVADGRECLITDEPAAFAGACARLLTDPVLGPRLARNARTLVERAHGPEALARLVSGLS